MPSDGPVYRPSARLLVVGPGDTLLLFQIRDSADSRDSRYWLTPGGGIRPDEATADAAARELREETGIRVDPAALGPVVAYSEGQWSADGRVFDANNSYFCIRVTDTRVDTSGQEELERSLITGHRWWRIDELATTPELIVEPGLAGLMRSLLADGPPAAPVRLAWR
jgi:8-oxo-dGTP pyrophosphatase MutT (NUDIX family)